MMTIARERMKRLPFSFYAEVVDKEFGGDIDAYVDYLYDRSLFADGAKVQASSPTMRPSGSPRIPSYRWYAR